MFTICFLEASMFNWRITSTVILHFMKQATIYRTRVWVDVFSTYSMDIERKPG